MDFMRTSALFGGITAESVAITTECQFETNSEDAAQPSILTGVMLCSHDASAFSSRRSLLSN